MKSSALMLNICVALFAFSQYYRRGHFDWNLFYPFALTSIPFSFIGATMPISDAFYKKILAVCLLIALTRLVIKSDTAKDAPNRAPFLASLAIGAFIGTLSGILGIGGGILLSPIILLMAWAEPKHTAATSALFIVVNSIAGLVGLLSKNNMPPLETYTWLAAALIGGTAGAYWGSHRLDATRMNYVLAVVLLIASLKLFFT
jgi:uncharacterized membrane protein YfcA